MSVKTLSDWSAVTPKSTIRFRDIASVRDSIAHKEGAQGLEFEVVRTTHAQDAKKLVNFVILRLQGKRGTGLLLITAVDTDVQAELYTPFGEEAFLPGTRTQMLDNRGRPASQDWIFSPPQDVANFQIGNLAYTKEIDWNGAAYSQAAFGEIPCPNIQENPVRSGLGSLLLSVAKYSASVPPAKALESLILLLETGSISNEDGGLLELFSGRMLSTPEIEVISL